MKRGKVISVHGTKVFHIFLNIAIVVQKCPL